MTMITQIKTTKQCKRMLKLLPLDAVMTAVSTEQYHQETEALRDFLRYAYEGARYDDIHRLPTVCPAAEIVADGGGNLLMRHFNGLLTLSVSGLNDTAEAREVKDAVAMLPSTVAAVTGSSGRTVKVVVRIARDDDTLPQDADDAEALCRRAATVACRLYEVAVHTVPQSAGYRVAPALLDGEGSLLHTGFRMTSDDHAVYRPDARPLTIHCLPGTFGDAATAHTPDAAAHTPDAAGSETGQETRQLIALLERHYAFRMNTVMGYVEYRRKDKWHLGWRPVDDRMQNSIAINARLQGINVWDKDVKRYLISDRVPQYDPIVSYLWELRGQWDGEDHIARLAATVPTDNAHWPAWFRTWFLAMVAQWLGKNRRYGNSTAPLLISRQGYNKSTFCKSLLPLDLQWGYNDNLVISERKGVLQAMSQFLLINLDEFNQIPAKIQEGFLKNLIQLATVKVKRPYGKHVEDFPRLASFIATANVTDILADPSGNRRFFGIELTGPIDTRYRINHRQLYAQAVALLDQGEPYWFDDEQTKDIMRSNQKFREYSPAELYFRECFDVADSENDGVYMTAAAIFSTVRKAAGSTLRSSQLSSFGRFLANIEGIRRRRVYRGTEYLVAPRST